MKKLLLVLIAIPVFFWSVWIVLPGKTIQSIIENSAPGGRISLEVKGIQKGLFYNFLVADLVVKDGGGELISLKHIHGRINPFGLSRLRLELLINGAIGPGEISGHMDIGAGGTQATFEYRNVGISDMPIFKRSGIRGTGPVSGRFSLAGDKGHVEFAAARASFEPALFSGIKVPLNLFHSVSGAIDIKENVINIASISLEGKDVNARLKGVINADVMDLTMELMPGRTFLENPLFLNEVDKYKVSPGYYVIPIKGAFPL